MTAEGPDTVTPDDRAEVTLPRALVDEAIRRLEPFAAFAGILKAIGRDNFEFIDAEIWLEDYRRKREVRTALIEAIHGDG